MSYRDILLYLDDGKSNHERTTTVLQMAASQGARVTAVTLNTIVPPGIRVKDPTVRSVMAKEAAEERIAAFIALAKEYKIESDSRTISEKTAVAVKKVAQFARNFDLVVLRQANPASPHASMQQELGEQVLLLSGRPVFFMPYIGAHRVPCRKAMIAYDGTPSVTRAVHDALPILKEIDEISILVVRTEVKKVAMGEVLADHLVEHLQHHGVNVSLKRVYAGTSDVAVVIENAIAENDIDLLVMGGYGTPSLQQKIFGGVTKTLLSSMLVPVIMSH
ncbi:universal stress protein [Solemya velum gill symbiont]|uniref:universal stress protein n=1 Tax=Solemya velum gill symbiont TaxID=2340 RepID=UPI0009980B90|nr:universal stress protein [Solemya velum gill symbiont]OOZ43558.1 hypothetical protein BOW37_10155 [Solemya velum gill symbiont]OOZ45006.1 hypothetical protein BOW38_10315 [Solemya velum gill symbiont]OOZ48419.1 hypothetical protein BOW39_10935 [Solemya velum gill symbiont]OOZ50425.1 hypothetical protein BOW40_10160 [Solemya velum gill symbiont]OOZ53282.1 hypothetical protein BOW42_13180 [Solemya velum gill symbiont]